MRVVAVSDGVVHRPVDAIVNAANEQLAHGGGVALAIARAAGPELDAASRRVAPVATGRAAATQGYRLPARWVIHAVGPMWRGGSAGEPELLASAYRDVLRVADEIGARTIAVCPLSVGIFGYPLEAGVAVGIGTLLATPTAVEEAEFCGYTPAEFAVIERLLAQPR